MALETANPAHSASRNLDRPVISGQVLRPAQPGIKLTVRGRRLVALLALLPIVAAFILIGTRSAQAETALMKELVPLLTKRAQGREISGLSAYEQ